MGLENPKTTCAVMEFDRTGFTGGVHPRQRESGASTRQSVGRGDPPPPGGYQQNVYSSSFCFQEEAIEELENSKAGPARRPEKTPRRDPEVGLRCGRPHAGIDRSEGAAN